MNLPKLSKHLIYGGVVGLLVIIIQSSALLANPNSVTIAGDLQSELGCTGGDANGDWLPDCAATHLTLDAEDDVWQASFVIPQGSYSYKAALNDDWAENYGANAQADGNNIPLTVEAVTNTVKFYYDDKTHWVTDNQTSMIATVPGSFQRHLGCTTGGDAGNWDPGCLRSWLQDPDGDGIYTFSTNQIPAGDYEGKVAINEDWAENYGVNGELNGDNYQFTVPEDGQVMNFTFSAETKVLSIVAAEPPDSALNAELVRPALRSPIVDDVMYFVMPDRFDNGDPDNDDGGLSGDKTVTGFDPTHKGFYHGGDLAGLLNRLDYLDQLGVTAIWMTPTFKNIPYDPRRGDTGYHGYWITDFTQFDPHLGTNAELETLIEEAHKRGIKIFFDIITNHTADVIQYQEGEYGYRNKKEYPYRDAQGNPFDDREFAGQATFPQLSAETSFPYTPVVSDSLATIKKPDWLNNPIYYHNRGDSNFIDENSLYGDFDRLDDLFTEHPEVVNGMIDIYKFWVENYDIDGFRVDTVKHVNVEFWQAFAPAIIEHARQHGKPNFYIFGEVFSGDGKLLSYYPTVGKMPAVLDFGFQSVTRAYVSQGGNASDLKGFFEGGDRYTDADSNAYFLPTFIGNHDMGRFGLFLNQDNVPADQKVQRSQLGHAFMFFARGTPVIYYGAEQGFTGDGNDQDAREDMMPSQVDSYNDNDLLGTDATTADSNFDTSHPLYQAFSEYAQIYQAHKALRTGAQIYRYSSDGPGVYAFSKIDREEKVEYLVAFNNRAPASGRQADRLEVTVPTFYTGTTSFDMVYDSTIGLPTSVYLPTVLSNSATTTSTRQLAQQLEATAARQTNANGELTISVPDLGFVIYKANRVIPTSAAAPEITMIKPLNGQTVKLPVNSIDGNEVVDRLEVAAKLERDIFAEVTFAVKVNDGDYTPIGTDDNPPYRVFYDVTHLRGQTATLSFGAIVNDMSGNVKAAEVKNVGLEIVEPAPLDTSIKYGVIHYQRTGNDYDGWGVQPAGDGVADNQLYDTRQPFIGETDYGRFAFVRLTDPAMALNVTLANGSETDGAARSFVPATKGEIWLKQGEATVYNSQAEAQGYVTIRYHRSDGDYTGVTLEVPAANVTGQTPTGSDDYGAYFQLPLTDFTPEIAVTINKSGAADIQGATFKPTEIATAWLKQGDTEVYPSQGAAEGYAMIHYHRPDGEYGDWANASADFTQFWGLHTFGGAADPGWETPRRPAGEDAFGVYFKVVYEAGAEGFGYIIHKGNLKDPNYAGEQDGPNMKLDMAKYGNSAWHVPVTYQSRAAFNPDNPPPVVYPIVGEPTGQ